VPPFFSLAEPDARLYAHDPLATPFLAPGVRYVRLTIVRDWSLDLAAWSSGPHPTTPTVGPIVQLIFAFPKSSYLSLASASNRSASDGGALDSFLQGTVFVRPGSVTSFPNAVLAADVDIASFAAPPQKISTRAGNVGGVTGYYLYSSTVPWPDGQQLFVPEGVASRMPKLPDGSTEYSFYGSEAYCLVQRIRMPV
jgi:hypothetical protein